jgi:hypothetical protein
MTTYEIVKDELLNREIIKRYNEDGSVSCIPTDPGNSDYQAYLNKDNPDWNNQPTL